MEVKTTFVVYHSLHRAKVDETSPVPQSNFVSPSTTKITDRAHDDIYFLYSTSQDDSYTIALSHYLVEKASLVKFVGDND